MLDGFARQIIERFPLGFTATVGADGAPSLSAKGTYLVLSDTQIGFADIRSPVTMANLGRVPQVEVNFIDPFLRKGVRVKGSVAVHARGSDGFDAVIGAWATRWPSLEARMRAVVLIDVAQVKLVTTPPYDDGASEAEMIALYKETYAEIYP